MNVVGSAFSSYQCLEFNGVDQYAYIDNPSFRHDSQGSVALWMWRLTPYESNNTKKVCCMGHRGTAVQWTPKRIECSIHRGSSGHGPGVPILMTNDGSTNGAVIANANPLSQVPAGEWVHVVWTQDGVRGNVYVNGIVRPVTTPSGGDDKGLWWSVLDDSDTVRFVLGCGWFASAGSQTGFTGSYIDSRIDEVTVYARALTDAEVLSLYGAGVARNPLRVVSRADIRSHWRMGESGDDATTIYDCIGSNNLTLVNGPGYVNV